MKKIVMLIAVIAFSINFVGSTPIGPAPNAGDGIPDGSGLDRSDDHDEMAAPNSGDGAPDGSGF